MRNQNFLHPLSLVLLSYMHITNGFHNYSSKTPQTSLAYAQQIRILLQQITPLLQISYVIQSESVLHFVCFEQSSTNSMNTLTRKSKSHTIHSLNIIIYIPFLEKWLSVFIHDCIECKRNKHFNMKIQTAPTQSSSELAPSFNYRISMDTKGHINPP